MQRLFLAPNACSPNRIKCTTWLVFYNTSTLLEPGALLMVLAVSECPAAARWRENDCH